MNGVDSGGVQGWQEWVALGVVFAAALLLIEAPFRGVVLKRISERLLKSGRVKWAMRVRHWSDPQWSAAGAFKKDRRDSHCE